MNLDVNPIRQKIAQAGTEGALDLRTPGLIGYVINYHREGSDCNCARHNGVEIKPETRHTVDLVVYQGQKKQEFYEVPCMVYSQGFFDHGLEVNDRVWVQFLNGDINHPVVTAYYRNPSGLDMLVNNFKFAVSDFFHNIFHL
jgi:hypothetical protein